MTYKSHYIYRTVYILFWSEFVCHRRRTLLVILLRNLQHLQGIHEDGHVLDRELHESTTLVVDHDRGLEVKSPENVPDHARS